MTIEHSNITDPEIHEPKGVSTASGNTVYLADGAGSGNWENANPHGGLYYKDFATGTTFTGPTTYTLVDVVSTATHLDDITHNSLGRLTYIGTSDRHFFLTAAVSVKHSTGTGQDIYWAIHKNGVIENSSETVRTADSGNFGSVAVLWDGILSSNDYIELFVKCASGNVVVHSIQMNMKGFPD